jgi:hypothetical protein
LVAVRHICRMFVASARVVFVGAVFSHCPTSLNPRHRSLFFFNYDGDARRSTQTRNCPSHRYLAFPASIDVFSYSKHQVPLIVIDLDRVKHGLLTRRHEPHTSTPRTSPHHQGRTFAQKIKPPLLPQVQVQDHLLQYVLHLALALRSRSPTM